MSYWIIDNMSWLGPAIMGAVSTVWIYLTTKSKRGTEKKLRDLEVRLQNAQADNAYVEVNDKVNKAVDAALERAFKLHDEELARYNERYARDMADLDSRWEAKIIQLETKMQGLTQSMQEAEILKQQALDLASTYEELIKKLQKYNMYLKAVLDANNINYKEEDEI